MSKKNIILIISLILLVIVIVIIGVLKKEGKSKDISKIKVETTLFPQYDFVKQIGKDKVQVDMLLPAGVESHSYEPTPTDIININNSDIFIYTGKEMEPWAEKIVSSIDSNTKILNASTNINLINTEKFEEEHTNNNIVEDEESEDGHHHENDPHIWMDPNIASQMVDNILESLCNIDPSNENYYKENAKEYKENLGILDKDIYNVVKNSNRKNIVFGGAFAYAYFVQRYGLDFVSAYDSCGEESEPSVAKVKSIIDYVKANNIPVIFYQDLTEGSVAKNIADETGIKALPFYSLHNVSKDEIDNGATYIELMRKNLDNLKIALN